MQYCRQANVNINIDGPEIMNTQNRICLFTGEVLPEPRRRHNQSKSPEYRAWSNMKQRCYNLNIRSYKDYGARGIKVCDRWLNSFANFLEDMGLKPDPRLTLERVNNDGNYEPGNCKWATAKEQIDNQRKRRIVCIGCHVEFCATKSWQRFCSANCRMRNLARVKRADAKATDAKIEALMKRYQPLKRDLFS